MSSETIIISQMNISLTHRVLILFHLTDLIKKRLYLNPNIQVLFPFLIFPLVAVFFFYLFAIANAEERKGIDFIENEVNSLLGNETTMGNYKGLKIRKTSSEFLYDFVRKRITRRNVERRQPRRRQE